MGGRQAGSPNKRKLDQMFVAQVKPQKARKRYWDTVQKGFVLVVEPTGSRSYKVMYRHGRKLRWYTIDFGIGLKEARKFAAKILLQVASGLDPQAEKMKERRELQDAGSFRELSERYVEGYAKERNKSWKQADKLVRRYLLPHIGKLAPAAVERKEMKRVFRKLTAENGPVLANQVLAAASRIFSWAMKEEEINLLRNPCYGIDRNDTKERERVLDKAEVPLFWNGIENSGLVASSALKVLLLTGQRPVEVSCMRHEHIIDDNWWVLPGEPDEALCWPGTKNKQTHQVWLTDTVLDILEELAEKAETGFVFTGTRENSPIATSTLALAMREVSTKMGLKRPDKVTPHDLRRTHGATITSLGFTREQMNRLQKHKEGGIASVYDRHHYRPEFRNIQETVSARILDLVHGRESVSNVIPLSS